MLSRLARMESPLLNDIALLILRLALGGSMLLAHGLGKFQSFGENSAQFPDPFGLGSPVSMGLAVFAEMFCSILIILGALTRVAAIPLIVTMGVAFFMIHGADPWNMKELSFVYLAGFIALFCLGAGRISVDGVSLK
jgi:putative oxidoreductase